MTSTASFSIHPATAADQAAIRRLVREGGINPLGLHWSRFVVAQTADGAVIGCGQIKQHWDGSRELASIAVTADARGRGVASAVIGALLHNHSGPLWLMCRSELVGFYDRFGFVEETAVRAMPPSFAVVSALFGPRLRRLGRRRYLAIMRRPGRSAAHPVGGLRGEAWRER